MRPAAARGFLLAPLCAWSLAAAALPTWYESDAAGFELALLPARPAPGTGGEYLLSVESSAGGETRELWREGELVERRVTTPLEAGDPAARGERGARLERIERSGSLAEIVIYRADGAILEERLFAAPGSVPAEGSPPSGPARPEETRRYSYAKGLLVLVEAFDAEGRPVGRLDYRYDPAGRLAGLSASGSFGEGSAALAAGSGAVPRAALAAAPGGSLVVTYDREGRLAAIDASAAGKPATRETWSYGEGRLPLESRLEDFAAGTVELRDYDEAGRLVLVSLRRQGSATELSRLERSYDAAGRLVAERNRRPGLLESRVLVWAEDSGPSDEAVREEYRSNGSLTRVVLREGKDGRSEELYEGGLLFLRTTWVGGRLVREEFYENGLLARTRERP